MASTPSTRTKSNKTGKTKKRIDSSHYLYMAVIVAVVLGIAVGLIWGGPEGFAVSLKPLGDLFIALIKMMIAPIIFCTIILGIGSIAKAATVGKIGGLALGYFLIMSTFALGIGLVVGNMIHPGEGINLTDATFKATESADTKGFLLGIVPATLFSSLTSGNILQTLLVALIAGFALQKMGPAGKPILEGIAHVQALVFRILIMVMWLAPIGAFGAIAAVVGATGIQAVISLFTLMAAFYITCIIFIVVILGGLLKLVTGVNIFKLMRYLGREYLLIFSTSSSEAALPRLIAKMEHLGISKPVVGVTVPTGYSFNLDGTAIYLTMASLFIANALGQPLALGEQIGLLVFMIIASKGAAGVSGAGLATLAAGLQAHAPQLVGGVGFIVGIDRFMSEARALTNFTGNAVATVMIGSWTKEIDRVQVDRVLDKLEPFDERTMLTHGHVSAADTQRSAEKTAQSEVLERAPLK
ncbi:cation:dicarboxylase symporter family transporter [Cryobacterium sp. PH31-O1]|uniref:cation:dicarboxylate symporter family transporter n=1 Tax=Cryobacterium sp. PH31-O1 TaxID=3046306 RepID=UPI0024BAD877|nr:cation:dicarboxylase symporter family transporter [Cryobacterium sp. PH31-O1]MDJ0337353.1 cation:dicarboxylase symporter family transporter [Cryobacterium sp. PH31-O1]